MEKSCGGDGEGEEEGGVTLISSNVLRRLSSLARSCASSSTSNGRARARLSMPANVSCHRLASSEGDGGEECRVCVRESCRGGWGWVRGGGVVKENKEISCGRQWMSLQRCRGSNVMKQPKQK